ncbi:NAD(P)-binding protein [Aspergillus karnatakaensis]|uniref:NAD(P)-binding protein n=1 Tax=Aspergillus karnatakaensis TaxID=1810916 RepID=UPI003CCE2914
MAPLDISKEKLLITGVSGYIGFKTLLIALERGYTVRALVRKETHVTEIQKKSAAISNASKSGKLEFAVVPDFLAKDAVYNVLHGITVIIHLASPLAIQTDKYQEDIIDPAVSMVTVFLDAAERVKTVRRVVVTSSCVTLIPFEWNMNPDSERLYTPKDINPSLSTTPTSPMEAYWISKGLARKATHDFIASRSPSFDFVNLLAGVVIGPDDRLIPSETNTPIPASAVLEGTRASVLAPALTADLNSPFPYVAVPVHVSDVAKSHVDAVDSDLVPGNTEYILASDTPEGVNWDKDVQRVARKYFSKEVETGLLKLEGSLTTIKWRLDASETERVFGWKHTDFEETVKGLIAQYLELKKVELS